MDFEPRSVFAASPVARLATVTASGRPHLVPVVFAVQFDHDNQFDHNNDVVYTAVDAKPKSTQRLRRLQNIEANAAVSLLVDHYADDWAQLWWVRADGTATVAREGAALATGYRLLRAKYEQYQFVSLDGPVIAITVTRWSNWHA